jgi:hypothetical protein
MGYMAPDNKVSLATYFAVSKGEDNIRVVFNGMESGLNASTLLGYNTKDPSTKEVY